MLQFFIIEIVLKTFALFLEFLKEPINIFDAIIVIISYYMILMNLKAKILGILRVLRLIKVITQMKKVADKKKADQEKIKKEKRQGSQMASHVEKVTDLLDRLAENTDVPKTLREDV